MKDLYREWVAGGLLKKGRTKGGLAKKLGVHQSQITRMLDGRRQIKAAEIPIISDYLGIPPPEAAVPFQPEEPDESHPPTVRVKGYVGAGAEAHFYAAAQGDLDEVPAPEGSTPHTVAVEIRGESLGSLFDHWLVFYDEVHRPITSDLLGKLCIVGLADERVLIKKVRSGSKKGLYRLISEREDPIEDVSIEWAARVKNMAPRS